MSAYSQPLVQKIIKGLKYRLVQDLGPAIGSIIANHIDQIRLAQSLDRTSSAIVPVPLFRRRYNERGFNQSHLIARELSSHFQIPLRNDFVVRTKYGTPQADVADHNLRSKNIENVFSVPDHDGPMPAHIILVDDVVTTGSTLNACARTLKEAGVTRVTAIVFAKG